MEDVSLDLKEVNVSETFALSDLRRPPQKHQKTNQLTPVTIALINTQLGKSRFKKIRILLDSGSSGSIILEHFVCNYPCMMVEQQPIDEIVTVAMLVVESQDIGAIGPACHSCREISRHLVCPVFFDIATDSSKYGIFGCLPWELLHLYSLGILKYLLHAVHNYRQVPPTLKDWYSHRCNHNQDCSSDDLSDTGDGDTPTTKPTVNFKKLPKLFKKPEFKKNIRVVQHASW